VAAEDFVNPGDRVHFMRAKLFEEQGRWFARPLPRQGSHVISSIAHADCLVEVPESNTILRGATVQVLLIDSGAQLPLG
jgi:molybdopterin biosynthesis enzyme